ncbi:MAG: ribulose-phosphate 3-epimerase [Gammaproteobacteria bacterium CG_4_10_14_0_8_um_filter_38_16]|nr:MAG: ribulose-phosphate 3-epimerase [Gammaproteobacteria bacterium CG_4_10_14_0_8_um_filter_38_16]PJA03872.1 MAG: ribulose-phosphate 3-epimerase [Gammaproteobacteria bacterium CG_4_10_14_0_2_um_filter_38_22]PJB09514.1 MAG: ribulose-phosphate 3-epimerase [Gammaproteobacteria bacterium CG_4_9_14_3_um_filter_38_9]
MSQAIIFAASILSANFAQLGKDCKNILKAGANVIHFDVMDHHFVPNLTFGSHICSALRNDGITAEIDVHLMVTEPEKYIAPFAKAGANRLTFHPSTVSDPVTLCKKIHDAGMQAGLAFNPDKEIMISDDLFLEINLILIMSVFAGFGGQKFIPSSIEKITNVKNIIRKHNPKILLGVDGGINVNNIRNVVDAGANFIVMGSALFGTDDYVKCINMLRAQLD